MSNNKENSKNINLLRLQLTVCNSSAAHNGFTINTYKKYNITVCSLYKSEIQLPKRLIYYSGNGKIVKYLSLLKKLILNGSYDIIHAHTVHVAFLFIIVSIIYDYRILNKTVFTVHNSYDNYKFRNKILFYLINLFFSKIIYCSRSSFLSFPNNVLKNNNKNIIISNGVNIDKILSYTNLLIKKNNNFNIIVLGRLVELKNPYKILNAFNLVNNCTKNVQLTFIGDGPLLKNLMRQKHDNIIFKGLIDRNMVYEELHRSDLFVSMSRTEGLPVAVLEAMAAALPVILSDINPHREIAGELTNIDFVPLDTDENYLKEVLLKYINKTDTTLNNIGEANQTHIKNKFSLETMLLNYENIYMEIIGSS